jgi:hypothetical protein
MLASIFSKTKPINYIILTILIVVSYSLCVGINQNISWTGYEIAKKSVLLILLLLTMYLSQWIVSRNRLVNDNAYVPLLFVSFLLLFPSVLVHTKVIISNYFVILALRRIFSLHSLKQSKEKIFDASFWIFVASLFYFWSILFIILVLFAIAYYGIKDYKNWVIPFLALFCVMIFLSLYLGFSGENYIEWFLTKSRISFDFLYFENIYQNIALAVFTSIALLYFITQLFSIKTKSYNMQNMHKKMILSFVIGVVIYIISSDKNNGVLMFTFFPLAVLGANYIERIPQNWRREANIYTIFFIGVFFWIAQLIL